MALYNYSAEPDGSVKELADQIRSLIPDGQSVTAQVEEILKAVKSGGDEQLINFSRELDGNSWVDDAESLKVSEPELRNALELTDGKVVEALKVAIANVTAVSTASLPGKSTEVALPEGHTVTVKTVPVGKVAVYVPGGKAPYPSTVIMGVCAAKAAGVDEVVVISPSRDQTLLAACTLAGADHVLTLGGAHGVAAVAYGTESIDAVDMIVGPGNLWVQEAKRQVNSSVGIDGFAGPSDILIVADDARYVDLICYDLAAQAEHGSGSIAIFVTTNSTLAEEVSGRLSAGFGPVPAAADSAASYAVVVVESVDQAIKLSNLFAPEHLELIGSEYETKQNCFTSAGCVFVGPGSATAFGDYVAGSNHTLPTDGAAKFSSGLSARSFVRTQCVVSIDESSAEQLATHGIAIANAEGFAVHAASMQARQNLSYES